MPFIKRGKYYRIRSGEPTSELYTLADITAGNDIELETVDQPLPDSSKTARVLILRICDVDVEAKKSILLASIPSREADGMWKRLQMPSSPELFKTKRLIYEIHEITRRQVSKRGIKVYTGVGRLLRRGDLNRDGLLNKFELEKSLVDFRINLPQDKFDDLWDLLDPESESFLHYDEFMRSFIGEMNEFRKSYVIKAFVKMDTGKRGFVTFGDVRKFYNASRHPKVASGECSDDEITAMFLDSFETVINKGELSFREFEEYYEGLSLGVEDDREFVNILKNAWNI